MHFYRNSVTELPVLQEYSIRLAWQPKVYRTIGSARSAPSTTNFGPTSRLFINQTSFIIKWFDSLKMLVKWDLR